VHFDGCPDTGVRATTVGEQVEGGARRVSPKIVIKALRAASAFVVSLVAELVRARTRVGVASSGIRAATRRIQGGPRTDGCRRPAEAQPTHAV
jgi:hypothetical protein